MSDSTLSVLHIAKQYQKRWVVKDVSFSFSTGQVVGLLGPNGAGKTTSFYMVVGLVKMDKGQLLLNDQDISGLTMHQRARFGLGYLPQEASIFKKMTVEENILAVLELQKDLDAASRESALEQLLEEFRIGHIRLSQGMSLSGGERRRVEIARALAARPKFMLLDEPFAGVDPISVGDIKEIIDKLKNRGLGVLITDHNVRETLSICDKAYIVSEGSVIASGSSAEVLDNELVRQVYLGENFKV